MQQVDAADLLHALERDAPDVLQAIRNHPECMKKNGNISMIDLWRRSGLPRDRVYDVINGWRNKYGNIVR